MNNHSASTAKEFCLQAALFRPDPIPNESRQTIGHSIPRELRDDNEEEEEEEDGCQSSLSLNEILDSAAGSTNGSTDAEEGNEYAGEKRSLEANEEGRSRNELFETDGRNDFGGGLRYCEEVCNPGLRPSNLNVFVDMSASDSFALLSNCSCSNGQFIHLSATSLAKSGADINSNLVSKSESAPLDERVGPPSTGSKNSGHRKVFRGDSGWKKFLPVGCTSPQEERDEGYLSNKTSEGSSDVSNPFASQMSWSYRCWFRM